ncbi:baseplate hub subunit and tail length [Pectobacterium bacteriophage PM2]|uniref:Baseplate hub subunit tail length determinator n=1 Tax=Pectobacterium bacteriophage PM2 TaxID=1429794 RepID=A0A0A0Q0M0_9CAUD|nr:baseplate hub subunit and tail length [Pectobacterium bacteriophage PM2]AHY25176.1 baseplate hub subunit tail length determinator [Pectobacterium bacteriophage PM2]
MKNKSEATSMRRNKLIEEMAPQRRAEALSNTQNAELSNINNNLSDSQAAMEMVAETIENKGNQIIGSIGALNKNLDNTTAGVELVAENTENVSKSALAISDKLSKLTEMLSTHFSSAPKAPVKSEDDTLKVIDEKLEQPETLSSEDLLKQLVKPHENLPDADFIPPVHQEEKPKEEKEKKNNEDEGFGAKLSDLAKISKTGFKGMISVTDRIAGMLFKYTVSAAASAAKFAAMIFSVVLGIDMIKVYFQYFMKQFEAGWDKFAEKFEEWGPLLSSLIVMAKNISQMFSDGNWLGLAEAIIKGVGDVTVTLGNLLMLGISKLTAAILRATGFEDAALNVEGSALQAYQQKTGAKLDDEDSTTLAKYQDKKDAETFEAKNKLNEQFKDKDQGLNIAEQYGTVSKETASEIRSGGIDSSFRDMPEQERLDIIKKRNEAQASIIRLTRTAESIMKPDETDIKNAKESYDNIQTQLNDPKLKAAPKDLNMEQLLENMNRSLEKFNQSSELKPQAVQDREEVQQAQRVDAVIKQKESSRSNATPQMGNLVQQVNVQKNNKTQYNMPPQSSTPAPGMNLATRVN